MAHSERWHTRFRLTIAYVILSAGVLAAVSLSWDNQNDIEEEAQRRAESVQEASEKSDARIERQSQMAAYENCLTINEMKAAVRGILLAVAEPAPGAPPDPEREARVKQFLERTLPFVQAGDCPPP